MFDAPKHSAVADPELVLREHISRLAQEERRLGHRNKTIGDLQMGAIILLGVVSAAVSIANQPAIARWTEEALVVAAVAKAASGFSRSGYEHTVRAKRYASITDYLDDRPVSPQRMQIARNKIIQITAKS